VIVRYDVERFHKTVIDFFDASAEIFAQQVVVIDKGVRCTYQDLLERTKSVASYFKEYAGIQKGDRIALFSPNCIEYVIAYYAALRIGAIAVPVNIRLAIPEIKYQLNDSCPSLIVGESALIESIEPLMSEINQLKGIILIGGGDGTQIEDLFRHSVERDPKVDLHGDDPACIMYTSGTTGTPKGAVMSHWNIAYNSQIIALPPGLRFLCFVPFFHVTGLNASLNTAIANGGLLVLMERFQTEMAFKLIEEEQIELITCVPTILSMVVNWPRLREYDIGSLKYVFVGGAPLPQDLIDQTLKLLPDLNFIQVFGMTETTGRNLLRECHKTKDKFAAIGAPLPGVKTKIIDEEGFELPTNAVGECIIKGPNVIKQYWKKSEATQKSIKNGWLHTDDLMKIDEDGYHYIMGRKRDMIIRGGENVYPVEVENAICQHPGVSEAAVIGIANSIYGEEVMAFITLRQGTNLSAHTIQDFSRRYLAEYKIPSRIIFLDEIPKSATGKVIKNDLLSIARNE
jgi:acyl-CoA synthetase (AMP-forming)/AMP-acid ligase II